MCEEPTSSRSLCAPLPKTKVFPLLSGLNCGKCPHPLAPQSMTFTGVVSASEEPGYGGRSPGNQPPWPQLPLTAHQGGEASVTGCGKYVQVPGSLSLTPLKSGSRFDLLFLAFLVPTLPGSFFTPLSGFPELGGRPSQVFHTPQTTLPTAPTTLQHSTGPHPAPTTSACPESRGSFLRGNRPASLREQLRDQGVTHGLFLTLISLGQPC